MLEALILQHLTTHNSRNLNAQATRLVHSAANNNGLSPPGGDNDSSGHTPSSASGASSSAVHASPQTEDFLQRYMRMQGDLEKIHTLWPTSQSVLLSKADPTSRGTGLTHLHHAGSASSSYSPPVPSHAPGQLEEDVLAKVLKKGSMAYDTEPIAPEDIVVPNLPTRAGTEGEESQIKSPEDLFKDEENYFQFAWPIILHHQNSTAHAASFGRALIYEASDRLNIGYTPVSIE